jgi:hypothetical protein
MTTSNVVSQRKRSGRWVYTVEIIPQLETRAEWVTKSGDGSNPLFSFRVPFKRTAKQKAGKWEMNVRNAFEVRDAFLGIRDPKQALAFFQSFGPMQAKALLSTEASPVRFSSVIQRRDFYQEAFTQGSTADHEGSTPEGFRRAIESFYLNQNLPMEFVPEDPPVALVRCKDIEDCLRATFVLDKKEHLTLRYCARKECGKPFRVGRDKRKIFCDSKCARLQAQHVYLDRLNEEAAITRQKGKQRGTVQA